MKNPPLSVNLTLVYVAIHFGFLAITLRRISASSASIMLIIAMLILILPFRSNKKNPTKTILLGRELFFHVAFLIIGAISLGTGLFNFAILPTGYYSDYWWMTYFYISLGVGVFMINLIPIVLGLRKAISKM